MVATKYSYIIFILILLAATMFSVSCCCCMFDAKVWVTDQAALTLPASGIDTMEVTTYNGEISFLADSETTDISVKITIKAGGSDEAEANHRLDEIEIVEIREGAKQKLGWKWKSPGEAKRNNWQAKVSFEISLPPSLRTVAETYNGEVALTGMQSDARLKAYNGSLKALDHLGALAMETYNGSIKVKARTSNIKMESYNGTIKADLQGDMLEGSAKTYNGSIRLNIGGKPSTRFVCRTHNGSIHTGGELNLLSRSKHRLEASLGAGEGTLSLETYNGSITLQ